jgi:hypothetical protein
VVVAFGAGKKAVSTAPAMKEFLFESLTSDERWTVALDVPKVKPRDKNVPQGLKAK